MKRSRETLSHDDWKYLQRVLDRRRQALALRRRVVRARSARVRLTRF